MNLFYKCLNLYITCILKSYETLKLHNLDCILLSAYLNNSVVIYYYDVIYYTKRQELAIHSMPDLYTRA